MGLGARGSAFWRDCVEAYDLSDSELQLLGEAAHMIGEIDSLRAALATDGVTVEGSRGQSRVHPAVNEIRQHRLALARLLKAIDLPGEDVVPETQTTRDARAAANARWSMQRARQAGGS